jgi:hypothetical protein
MLTLFIIFNIQKVEEKVKDYTNERMMELREQ